MDGLINRKIICKSVDDTFNLASKVAKYLPIDSSLALIGNLGSGKTTFVKGLARGFGIAQVVNSPSFNIFNIYYGAVTLLHVDAYRLDGTKSATNGLMIDDFLISPYCLVVEWPENFYNFYKICNFKISFKIVDGSCSREICIVHSN
jgi:tRNA threonylcarbamoyladenosine biosynthesis protein TsaE